MRYCQVKLACKRGIATSWYYTVGFEVMIVPLTEKKPVSSAVRCCPKCAAMIWRRYEDAIRPA